MEAKAPALRAVAPRTCSPRSVADGAPEPRRDDASGGFGARGVSGHGLAEHRALVRHEPQGRQRTDSRRSGHVADERDLAEQVAGSELTHSRPSRLDRSASFSDCEEAIAGLT